MSRRVFLKSLTAPLGGFSLPAVAHTKPDKVKWKTLQISPVAGFQYYQGESLWPQLDAGQLLTLTREADNPYDDRAVCIDWQRHKLGYIPWMDNAAISQLIDRGEKVKAVCAEKDTLYAALNQEDWNWRHLHRDMARQAIRGAKTSSHIRAFVLDDSIQVRHGKKMPGVSSHFCGRSFGL